MVDNSKIEWTDATWNPVTGCTEVTPGCDHCYAKTFAERWRGVPGHHFERGFDVVLRPERLDQPLRWARPRRIFVNSMSDLFHDEVPDEFIARVWAVMAAAHQHTFQVLTKRHGRMRSLLGSDRFLALLRDAVVEQDRPLDDAVVEQDRPLVTAWPLPNVWLGVSVENQQWAVIRGEALRQTPAAVRFFSAEPLLGPIVTDLTGIDWVIVGGESGPGARPMHPRWARSLRDQCAAAGVPFLFKQWGEWAPAPWGADRHPGETVDAYKARAEAICATAVITNPMPDGSWALYEPDYKPWSVESGSLPREYADGPVRRVGKRAAGRELDGRTWDEFPQSVSA